MKSIELEEGYELHVFDGQNLLDKMNFDMLGAYFKVLDEIVYIDPGDGVITRDGDFVTKIGWFPMKFLKQI